MNSYSLLLGSRRTGRFSAADERRLVTLTRRHFPQGFTILRARGGWYDPQENRLVEEAAREIMVCSSSEARVRRWAMEVGREFGQKELLVVRQGRVVRLTP